MKKTFTVELDEGKFDVTFTKVRVIFDGEESDGILMHDERYEFCDGDCITGDWTFPETEEEAKDLIMNNYWSSYFHITEDNIYVCNE